MKYALATVLFLTAAIVQSSALPYFTLGGVWPNLVLILIVCWSVVRGQREAMVVVPIGGLCLGLVGGQPLGVALLATLPVVLLAELRSMRLSINDFLLSLLLVFLSCLVYEMVFLVGLRLTGESVGWGAAFLRVALPTSLVSALFTPPFYWLIWSQSGRLRRARSYA